MAVVSMQPCHEDESEFGKQKALVIRRFRLPFVDYDCKTAPTSSNVRFSAGLPVSSRQRRKRAP